MPEAAATRSAVIHCWDHLVVELAGADARPTAMVSLYAVSYSPELGEGNVAYLRTADGGDLCLGDSLELARRQSRRLATIGGADYGRSEPVAASFSRQYGRDEILVRIAAPGIEIAIAWERLRPGFWLDADAPALLPDEDIYAVFREAEAARVVVNGRTLPGLPFPDERWVPKVGRALSSCHAALAEVRVRPGRVS